MSAYNITTYFSLTANWNGKKAANTYIHIWKFFYYVIRKYIFAIPESISKTKLHLYIIIVYYSIHLFIDVHRDTFISNI